MGKFTEGVQHEAVLGPLRTGFKLKHWEKDFKSLATDDVDKALYRAGLLVYAKAQAIRETLTVTFSKELRATTKLRAFAAVANYNQCVLRIKTREAIEEAVRAGKAAAPGAPVLLHELSAVTVKLRIGADFRPDEVIQATVDGLQVPTKRILEAKPTLTGNPEFGKLDWDNVLLDFNLGLMYSHLESLWEDCCWNGYAMTSEEEGTIQLRPANLSQLAMEIVSNTRHERLTSEFALRVQVQRAELMLGGPASDVRFPLVKSIEKIGREQALRLEAADLFENEALHLTTMRAFAQEPYYADLIKESQTLLHGASLGHLMTGWAVVSSATARLRETLETRATPEALNEANWLPTFAPTLQFKALRQAVRLATDCNLAQATAIVEFLTYRGQSDREMWAQPLLPVSDDSVTTIFSAVAAPNLRRLVDVWLRQLGVDLSLRGKAFEAYMREEIRESIASSPLLSTSAKCLKTHLNFTPDGERTEEIDIVFAIGDLVVLGEAKCMLEPTEAKEHARHRTKVLEASAQIRRKVAAVARNRDQFRSRLAEVGIEVSERYTVQPMVLLNNAILAGLWFDGVPVVDQYILGVFFRGELIEFATTQSGKGFKTEQKRILYTESGNAPAAFRTYLALIPQFEPLIRGIEKRWVPIAPANEGDWAGMYLSVSCVPKVDIPDSAMNAQITDGSAATASASVE